MVWFLPNSLFDLKEVIWIFFERPSFPNFVYDKSFWVLLNLDSGFEGLSTYVGSTQILLDCFANSFVKKNSYHFWICHSLLKNTLLPWSMLKISSQSLPRQVKHQVQQVSTFPSFYFYLFKPQNLFLSFIWTLVIYKGTTRFPLNLGSK